MMSNSIEDTINELLLPKAIKLMIEGSTVYLMTYQNNQILRYTFGDKRLTTDCRLEVPEGSVGLLRTMKTLFMKKSYVVELATPVRWDFHDNPIPQEELSKVIERIITAVEIVYRECKIEFKQGREVSHCGNR